MQVALIAHTVGAGNYSNLDINEITAFIARVSNPSNQNNHQTSDRLIDYLIRHKHWSPFEHAYITLEITATRDIIRQILRHRSFTFQEFSQRYAVVAAYEKKEARLQDNKNRQSSIETDDEQLQNEWYEVQQYIIDRAVEAYELALTKGIAKEVARSVLPEGLTTSTIYMTGNVRSWIHYLEQRLDPSTQKEHREVAKEVAAILTKLIPSIF